jgi:hypothetical protein
MRRHSSDEPVWSVPVGIITEKKKDIQFFLISQREQEIEVEVGKDEWMKVNAGMTVRVPSSKEGRSG